MSGPTPGIASAPMPASNPNAPPSTTPVLAPAVAPSGAFVDFSVPISRVPRFSGNKTEMSPAENPALTNASAACSAPLRVE